MAAAAAICPAFAGGEALGQSQEAGIDELVVTAERRLEPLTTVPITMTALTARDLDQASISRLPQVAGATTGVQVQAKKGGGLPNFVIRGAGLLDYNPNNSPPAAAYVDEVYQPSAAMGEMALLDLSRIEILKGPQGGLYGRDASGGAIHVLTARPELGRRDGYLAFAYGRWSRSRLETASNVALGQHFALRLSALHEDGDGGWQYSLADNRAWGAPDRSAVRLQLRGASGRLDVNLKLDAGWDGSELPLGRSVPIYSLSRVCGAALQGMRDDAACLTLSQVLHTALRLPAAPSGVEQTDDGSRTLSQAFNRLANRTLSGAVSATYDLDMAVLSSVTAMGRFRHGQNTDFAASPDRLALQTARTTITTFSQELRLTSTTEGRFSWLAGAIWAEDDLSEFRSIDMRDNRLAQAMLAVPHASRAFLQLSYGQDSRYGAVYGQLGWRFTETISATADLRWSDQSKHYHDGFVGFARPYITRLSGLEARYELAHPWSGKATLDWRPRPGLMAYASVASGYKSGGVFGGFNQVAGQVKPYVEETVVSYEAGFKAALWKRRVELNGAVFHYDYDDVQGFTNTPSPAGMLPATYPLLSNLGGADHDGVELEGTARPASGLTLQGGLAWLDARFMRTTATSTSPEGVLVPLEGQRRPFAPKWSGFARARYETTLSSSLGASVQLDANFRSRLTFPVTPVETALGGVPGYTVVNARAALDYRPGGFEFAIWSTNLTNRRYRLDIGSDGLGSFTEVFADPRAYGVEITRRW